MEKKYIFLILLLLTVGFASVNTIIDIKSKVNMSLLESDLDVIFKEVLLNKENNDKAFIIDNGKSFIYSADELINVKDTSNIDYTIMNKSHQYDMEVKVSCTSDYKDYLSYTSETIDKSILIEAGEVVTGNIITELIKEKEFEDSLVLKCTLNYIPVSRDSIVEEKEYIVSFDTGYEEKVSDIKVKYYEEYGSLPTLERKNYKFLGWYTSEDVKVENNSLVKIKDNHILHAKWEYVCPYNSGQVWTFDYTGGEQTFTTPCDGEYKMELWGASGQEWSNVLANSVGRGAYVSGTISLNRQKSIYILVGGTTGFNGGGRGEAPGGGGTDVRLNKGTVDDFNNLKSRIIVAAGGGGGGYISWISSVVSRGDGGTLTGFNSKMVYTYENTTDYSGYGATQTSGGKPGKSSSVDSNVSLGTGKFGIGGYGSVDLGNGFNGSSGGGGGYYGGGHGVHPGNTWTGGGGGSSFISGHSGCNAIAESSTSSKIVHTGQPNHYSGYVFTNTKMIAGNASMPTHDGKSTMTGNSGNGYAKITLVSID